MPLTPTQQQKLDEMNDKFDALVMASNDLKHLLEKVQRTANDSDLALTDEQIVNLISKYTALRQALADKANALPTI